MFLNQLLRRCSVCQPRSVRNVVGIQLQRRHFFHRRCHGDQAGAWSILQNGRFASGLGVLMLTSGVAAAHLECSGSDDSEAEVSFVELGIRKGVRHNSGRQEVKLKSWRQCSGASCFLTKGPRQYMEDEYFISDDGSFFAVYDGHGGGAVSEYLRKRLYQVVEDEIESQGSFLGIKSFGKDIGSALVAAFHRVQKEIIEMTDWQHVGSTAVAIMLVDKYMWAINVGDSRAVLCRNGEAIDLTDDHKPNDPEERKRIEDLGGVVSWYGWRDDDGAPVPTMGAWRVNGNLALSRSMGDHAEAPFVTAEPDIKKVERSPTEDQFIIVASDGLWDVMSSQEAVDFCKNVMVGVGHDGNSAVNAYDALKDPGNDSEPRVGIRAGMERRRERMGQYLVEEAMRRGSQDNTTVVCIWLI
jgi:serine/threonine protein phosphatase PrpC